MQLKRLTQMDRNGVIIAEAVNIHIKHHRQKRRTPPHITQQKVYRNAPQGMAEIRSRDRIKIRKARISATMVNFVKSNP
jgi:hypothetical protein